MKRSLTALAVALLTIFALVGCNNYGNTFQGNTGAFLSFLSPPNIGAGHSDFTLTVTGRGFVAKTKVQWNGQPLITNFDPQNPGQVTATVPAALVAKPGVATIITLNPFKGSGNNGLSNPLPFIVNPPPNPAPVLTSITPSSAPACGSQCGTFTLAVDGSSFLTSSDPSQQSVVQWNAAGTITNLAPTSMAATATHIQVSVPNSFLANPGCATVTVFNPPAPPVGTGINPGGGGGGTSQGLKFTIGAGCAAAAASHNTNSNPAALGAVLEETPALSSDGRFVAFTAVRSEHAQIFLRDTCEGAVKTCQPRTILVSAASEESPGNEDSATPSISANGRYVAFSSAASNLVTAPPAGKQIYLRDTCSGTDASCQPSTTLISTDASGALIGTDNLLPSVSSSGRFVAFLAVMPSHAANTPGAPGNNSGYRQVFVRDTCLGVTDCVAKTTRVSLQPGDGLPTEKPAAPALGGDGKQIALPGGKDSTIFTRSLSVDDSLFLALTEAKP